MHMSQNLLIFQKLSRTKMWLYFCRWHVLCDETECFLIMHLQASEEQSDMVKHLISLDITRDLWQVWTGVLGVIVLIDSHTVLCMY